MRGGHYVELPFNSRAVINVRTNDNKCFLWSILSAIISRQQPATVVQGNHHQQPAVVNPENVENYRKWENVFKIDRFPVAINDVAKIERDNRLIINVFEYKTQYSIEPLYLSKDYDSPNAIDILYYNGHYMYLKHIEHFFKTGTHTNRMYLCKRCLSTFYRQSTLDRHKSLCGNHDFCKIVLPGQNNILKFKNHHYKNPVPFAIYVDFEAISIALNAGDPAGGVRKLKKQIASSFGAYIKSYHPELCPSQYQCYRNADVVRVFCDWIKNIQSSFYNLLNRNIPMVFTQEDNVNFTNATTVSYTHLTLPTKA